MPIPLASVKNIECQMQGLVTAGGSNNKNANFVFTFRRTSVINAVNKVNIESAFDSNICATLLAALNNRYTQTFNTVRILDDPQDPLFQASEVGVGGVAGDSMPMDVQCFILARTALRGKRFKGGKKLFPMSEADTTAPNTDILNAAAITRLTTFTAAWLGGFTDSDGNVWVPTVYSRISSQPTLLPVANIVATDVTAILINKRLGRNKKHEVKSVY